MVSAGAQQEFDTWVQDSSRTEDRHPEDKDRDSDKSDDEDPLAAADYYEKIDSDDEVQDYKPDMRSSYYLPSKRSNANTGPKGVIADAHAFEQARKEAASASKSGQGKFSAWRRESPQRAYGKQDEDELLSDADSDSSFMAKWREARMKEMRGRKSRSRSRTTSPPRQGRQGRRWGGLEMVDGEGYLEAVEGGREGEVCVVYIYDDLVSWLLIPILGSPCAGRWLTEFVVVQYLRHSRALCAQTCS